MAMIDRITPIRLKAQPAWPFLRWFQTATRIVNEAPEDFDLEQPLAARRLN